MYCSGKNLNDLIASIQLDLEKISNWCTFNKLCLNAKKTNVLCLSDSFHKNMNYDTLPKLKLFSENLNYVESCDYLGIRLDCKLNMNAFSVKVKSSVLHKIYMLSKIRKFLTLEAAVLVFKNMILPYFEYGNVFLSICEESILKKLDRIYIRGIKIALKSYDKIDEKTLLDKIKLLPLKSRREISISKLMFNKLMKNQVELQRKTSARIHDGPVIEWPVLSNFKFRNYTAYLGPTIWNRLPSNLRNIEDRDKFKTEIKKYYEKLFADI